MQFWQKKKLVTFELTTVNRAKVALTKRLYNANLV